MGVATTDVDIERERVWGNKKKEEREGSRVKGRNGGPGEERERGKEEGGERR